MSLDSLILYISMANKLIWTGTFAARELGIWPNSQMFPDIHTNLIET